MTATITFTGLGSGTDWTKIVDQLVQVESYRVNQMNTWKTTWQDKIKSIQGLNSRMLSLDSFVQSKNTASEFMATTATSSNTDVLTATSSSTATPGAHSVTVGSDIQDMLASQGVLSNITEVSSRDGNMTIYVGDEDINVPVTDHMTLSELQEAIEDADVSNILTAEIIDDGSSSNPKRLCITAESGGSSHLISVTANPTSLTFSEGSINPVINKAVWNGTSQATSSGFYLGSDNKTYTFTVPEVTVGGPNSASVTWTNTDGGSGSFVIPANYIAGTAIAVDGLVDDATHSSGWSGTSKATSGGNYTGSIDKSYTFTVPTGTVESEEIIVGWSESTTGRTGSITILNGYTPGTPIHVDGVNSVVEGSGWTGSSHATSSGNYTDTTNQKYTFTVTTGGIVGTDDGVVIHWQNTDDTSSGNIPLDHTYTGTAVDVEKGLKVAFSLETLVNDEKFYVDTEQGPTVSFSVGDLVNGDSFSIAARTGLKIAFSAGTLANTEQFYVDTFSNVDSVQNGTWAMTAPTVASAGHYLGSSNKTFNFSVLNSGTLGTDEIGIVWSDTEGNTSVVTIPSNYTAGTNLDVYQGLKINLSPGNLNLVAGNTFSIDVYSPQIQKGQDSGLAQVEQVVHSGFIDPGTTKVTAGDAIFSYIYGGRRASVSVAADTTLSGLVNLINNDTANPGVAAGILNDGLGLSTSYHLVLTGKNTGAPYTIENIQDTFTEGTFSSSDFSTTQEAQNSMLKVDGYPPDPSQYIQRSSNSVSDLITGVALSLVGPGTATVGISTDTNAIRTSIEYFVSSINFVLDYIKQETKYNPTTKKAGIMIGNYSYQIVRQRVTDIVTSSIPGLEDGVDPYTHLAQIGISTNPETGKWEIDSTTLDNALSTNLEGVKKLFVKDEITGTKDGVLELLTQEMAKLDDSESGPMNVLLDNYDGVISNIDKNIETEQKRVDLVKTRLQNQFALLETLLGQLAGQEKSLQSYIDQLPTIGGTSS